MWRVNLPWGVKKSLPNPRLTLRILFPSWHSFGPPGSRARDGWAPRTTVPAFAVPAEEAAEPPGPPTGTAIQLATEAEADGGATAVAPPTKRAAAVECSAIRARALDTAHSDKPRPSAHAHSGALHKRRRLVQQEPAGCKISAAEWLAQGVYAGWLPVAAGSEVTNARRH